MDRETYQQLDRIEQMLTEIYLKQQNNNEEKNLDDFSELNFDEDEEYLKINQDEKPQNQEEEDDDDDVEGVTNGIRIKERQKY